MACTHLSHSLIQERSNLFSEKGRYTRETSDSIIAIMGNRIKCELAGVVHSWTYSCFEALKVRDPRLEPVPHYRYYEDIRGDLEYIGPLGPLSPLSSTKKELTQFALTLSVSFYLIRASAACTCAMLRSLPSNSIVLPISGPCVCPLVATRIGINKFLPFTPVSF